MLQYEQKAPYVRNRDSAFTFMMDVVIALLPLYFMAFYFYGFRALMMGLFKTLASSGTDGIASVVGIAAALVAFATVAMGLMALLASKIFKQSFFMCYAIVLNAFSGFPINMLITTEAININTEEGDERDNITAEIMPKMLVAGFVCVTIVSVLLAGILVRFL